jgi:hypothetical protein
MAGGFSKKETTNHTPGAHPCGVQAAGMRVQAVARL